MESYRHYIYRVFEKAIKSWDYKGDVYAFSIYFWQDFEDYNGFDFEQTWDIVELNYNTIQQWEKSKNTSSSSLEAKWRYAFWLHDDPIVIGDCHDTEGNALRQKWMQSLEIPSDADHFQRESFIFNAWIHLVVSVVKELHHNRVTEKRFGRPIPFIFFMIGGYSLVEETVEANKPDILDDYLAYWSAPDG